MTHDLLKVQKLPENHRFKSYFLLLYRLNSTLDRTLVDFFQIFKRKFLQQKSCGVTLLKLPFSFEKQMNIYIMFKAKQFT